MGRGSVWGGGQWTVTKKIYISISGSVSYMKYSYSDIGVQSAVMHSCVLKRAKGFVSACEKESDQSPTSEGEQNNKPLGACPSFVRINTIICSFKVISLNFMILIYFYTRCP